MQEVWKDITGFEGLYQVSNLGRVKSFPRKGTKTSEERIMKLHKNKKGYLQVCLTKNGVKKTMAIHRLVATAFIPNPDKLPQVNHKDENKKNNNVENLEFCTNEYNSNYGNRTRKISKKLGKKVRCLETNIVYESIVEASRLTGISKSNIIYVCQNKYNQAKGYHWKYEDTI